VKFLWLRTVAVVGTAAVLGGCATAVSNAAPTGAGESHVHQGSRGAASAQPAAEADVRFMRDMIEHHAQALEMSQLAPSRTQSEDVLLLARRIDIGQRDEIVLMRGWLEAHGRTGEPEAGTGHEHHGHVGHHGHHGTGDAAPMHGMLTRAEMERLAAARGAEFDRLFLEFMIRHHEGAVAMIAELFETEDGGQDSEVFQMASHMDSDQRIEIARMIRMLALRQ
jgi:uncharacterized protein (DUF305 family)